MIKKEVDLIYDKNKYEFIEPESKNTLQFFITNKCNKRCKGCFYNSRLGIGDMDFEYYKDEIQRNLSNIQKVILLGGEPTFHSNLLEMIEYNRKCNLSTTLYTNGYNLEQFSGFNLDKLSIRIGILGVKNQEKNLFDIKTQLPITIIYMLRKNNIKELIPASIYSELYYNCKSFMISTIRDIEVTKDFWVDTNETISSEEYISTLNQFMQLYKGTIKSLHISRRGILKGNKHVKSCRFLNIFPNKEKIICPFDISLNKTSDDYIIGTRKCQKHHECLLQKIILKRKND